MLISLLAYSKYRLCLSSKLMRFYINLFLKLFMLNFDSFKKHLYIRFFFVHNTFLYSMCRGQNGKRTITKIKLNKLYYQSIIFDKVHK